MKSFCRIASIVVLAFVIIMIMAGCGEDAPQTGGKNPQLLDEDYVEATGVRVPAAVVYLSPDGATSTYQLEPTIIPESATNQKINYYVAPDDIQYFSVDSSGKIVAKKVTPEGKSIPIKIYSSTNPLAYTIVSVVIEYVEAKEVAFATDTLEVLYNSEPIQLEPIFTPYHAQDGRDVVYTSNETDVATVDSNGILTIKGVGITRIFVTGYTLSGRKVEGNIQVVVSYAPGKYRLEVTNQAPKFEQVIGTPEKISFNIIRLDQQCDPNPTIRWRVAGKRILSQDGEWQFEYEPGIDSTPSEYSIVAEITPKGELPIELVSQLIALYKPFTGFSLQKNEPEGQKYSFGEQIEFEPMMGEVDYFDWYIKNQGEIGQGMFISRTLNDHTEGAFTMNADFYGAYTLTVQGKVDAIVIDTNEYKFNIIKYMIGDRIQILPQIKQEEKMPDSFDWYLHSYDITNPSENIENKININGRFLGTTNGGDAYNYEGTTEGWFIISCTPTIRGLPVTINTGEITTKMIRYSTPFQVWGKEGMSTISYLNIDGTKIGKEYLPVIKWNQVAGANDFVIEIVAGSKIYIIDTTEKNSDTRGIIFRDYSIVLPSSMLTLEDNFSVRVRQKGGIYCDKVDYVGKSIALNHYSYLEEINFSINRYLKDMYEIGELLNYITIYKPKNLFLSSNNGLSQYSVRIYTNIAYRNVDNDAYPVFKESDAETDSQKNIYNLIYGAISAYEIKNIYNIEFEYFDTDLSFGITITINDNETFINQPSSGIKNYDFETNFSGEPRDTNFDEFAILSKETIEVKTSSQLYYAIMMGKRPLPVADSIAEEIYNEAKIILNSILGHNMTTYEKVLAIYDFLAKNVEDDKILKQYSKMEVLSNDLYNYAGYHLEGALLHRKALSQGTSKAFVLLCWMEGITAQRINGMFMQTPHSWNKVLIDEEWYNIDCAQARIQRENGAAISYSYFLISDARLVEIGFKIYGEAVSSTEDFSSQYIINGMTKVVTGEELESALQSYARKIGENSYSFGIEFDKSFRSELSLRNYLIDAIQTTFVGTTVEVKELLQITDRYFILVLDLSI